MKEFSTDWKKAFNESDKFFLNKLRTPWDVKKKIFLPKNDNIIINPNWMMFNKWIIAEYPSNSPEMVCKMMLNILNNIKDTIIIGDCYIIHTEISNLSYAYVPVCSMNICTPNGDDNNVDK